ncbi:MAG: 8-amino-7-oxononanoate synthase [Deltaproteobacteria bacterium]|nr:8-amino-7-oxononanoate synthase [Deltaproteobacteria bacterium]
MSSTIEEQLAALEASGRLRGRRQLESPQGVHVTLDGRAVVNFSSNDYLGLANHPALRAAAHEAIDRWGVGAGSSRLVVGNTAVHDELEAEVASWLRRPAARLFGSGFAANTGVIPALVGAGDEVFSDELNHASIIDGCRLSRARVRVFGHRDVAHLEELLREPHTGRRLVVTESLFSMDGDRGDLEAITRLAHAHDALVLVDDAHAVGAFGAEGVGFAGADVDLVVGTFGKALGGYGAFIAGRRDAIDLMWNRARSLVFSTGLPPVVCAAAIAAIRLCRSSEGDAMRARLLQRVSEMGSDSQIAPVIAGDDRVVMRWTARLLEAGYFAQGIRPPTVPAGTARLRVSLSAAHSADDIAGFKRALTEARTE